MDTKKGMLMLALALAPGWAMACSESMFREGVSLRQYAAAGKQPARILVVEAGQDVATDKREAWYAGMRRVGHEVVPVADSKAAAAALGTQAFDLLLAGPAQADAVRADVDTRTAGDGEVSGALLPRLLPVQERGTDCSLCVHVGAHPREVLRAIARALHAGD